MTKFLLVPFMVAAFAVGSIGSAIANDCGSSSKSSMEKDSMTKAEAKPSIRKK